MVKSAYTRKILIAGLLIGQSLPVFAEGVTVRVTTGSVTNAGWEHNLVRGNPNLGHFGWFPVVDNVQGTMKVYPAKGPDIFHSARSPKSIYKSDYTKPIHVPTIVRRVPEVHSPVNASQRAVGALSAKQVSAALKQNNNELAVQANLTKPNEIAVYPEAYGSLYGNTNTLDGKLSKKDVHAQIVHSAQTKNRQF